MICKLHVVISRNLCYYVKHPRILYSGGEIVKVHVRMKAYLEAHGIPFSVMLPLMEETIQKLHTLPPREAQTGPAARGDQSVMERHVRMLLKESQDGLAELYKTISQSIQDND